MLLLYILLSCVTVSFGKTDLKVKAVTPAVIHAEGPHWDEDRQILFYVDMDNTTVNSFSPSNNRFAQANIEGKSLALVIPTKSKDKYIIARNRDIALLTWDGKSTKPTSVKVLTSVESNKKKNSFNDGKADRKGRLWAGTQGPEEPNYVPNQGALYSFVPTNNFKAVKQYSPASMSNGIAWNNNDTLMFYNDSPKKKVFVFDFDLNKGKINNRRILFDFNKHNVSGIPDGMAIDSENNLWIATYNGSTIIKVDTSNGRLLRRIKFPVQKVTSCAFGGPNLDVLYVTTSRRGYTKQQLKNEPNAGRVFQLTGLGVKGQKKPHNVAY